MSNDPTDDVAKAAIERTPLWSMDNAQSNDAFDESNNE